ncbi:MAG: monovalent cation/H+ antiporter subunit D family protein [Syntrophobacteraceae bacterium]|nr:monovalent cation/H+ antiporter subunit D family protein [Syntrophobacteraceae bacterium]
MEPLHSLRPLIAVLVSLGVVPILLSSRNANVRETWTFVAAGVKFLIVVSMLPAVLDGRELVCTLVEVLPGVAIGLRVDAFGMLFALVASALWIITSAYSIGYMRGLKEHGQTRYYCFFALALSATIGAAFSANLLTLYLFYELLSFSTYPLVAHHQDAKARRSGRKYLLYIVGASIGLALPAMILCYELSGTLEFSRQGFLAQTGSPVLLTTLLFMFLFGFAKAGIMPLHAWLPAAMVAPTPVSALLHAVAVVKVGVFCILRVLTGVFGLDLLASLHLGTAVAYVAAFTILAASLIALSQDELKRRLAFSTIGQLSYIVLGAALLSPKGLTGAMVHIAMHAFGKITLFFCAGAIFVATGKKYISQMVGIGRRMPITMAAFFIGSLSVIGLPPTGGFVSKWHLVLGTLPGHQWPLLLVLLISSLLNAAYFLPIVYRAFFCQEDQCLFDDSTTEAPLWCLIPLTITAACTILFFFYPFIFVRLAELAGS